MTLLVTGVLLCPDSSMAAPKNKTPVRKVIKETKPAPPLIPSANNLWLAMDSIAQITQRYPKITPENRSLFQKYLDMSWQFYKVYPLDSRQALNMTRISSTLSQWWASQEPFPTGTDEILEGLLSDSRLEAAPAYPLTIMNLQRALNTVEKTSTWSLETVVRLEVQARYYSERYKDVQKGYWLLWQVASAYPESDWKDRKIRLFAECTVAEDTTLALWSRSAWGRLTGNPVQMDFNLPAVGGGTLDSQTWPGKWKLLYVRAAGFLPPEEKEQIQKLLDQYRNSGIVIAEIVFSQTPKSTPETWPRLLGDAVYRNQWNFQKLPTVLVLDSTGKLMGEYQGPSWSNEIVSRLNLTSTTTGKSSPPKVSTNPGETTPIIQTARELYRLNPGQTFKFVVSKDTAIRMSMQSEVGLEPQKNQTMVLLQTAEYQWSFMQSRQSAKLELAGLPVDLGIAGCRIEGPAQWLQMRCPGDIVLRPNLTVEQLARDLETYLRDEKKLPVRIHLRWTYDRAGNNTTPVRILFLQQEDTDPKS